MLLLLSGIMIMVAWTRVVAEETQSGGENGSRVLRVTGEPLLISALHDVSLNSQRESNEGRKCQYSEALSPL